MDKHRKKILVLGIGNILLRDEGIGVRVIEYMQRLPRPRDVEFVASGLTGADLINLLSNRHTTIIVDAVDHNAPAGTIIRTTPENWRPALQKSLSLLELEITQTSTQAETASRHPERIIHLGIVPEVIQPGMTLSSKLDSLVPAIAQYILEEIASLKSASSSLS